MKSKAVRKPEPDSGVITADALAARWGMHTGTLTNWRSNGEGPPFIKLGGRRILYRMSDIIAFERKAVVRQG